MYVIVSPTLHFCPLTVALNAGSGDVVADVAVVVAVVVVVGFVVVVTVVADVDV